MFYYETKSCEEQFRSRRTYEQWNTISNFFFFNLKNIIQIINYPKHTLENGGLGKNAYIIT